MDAVLTSKRPRSAELRTVPGDQVQRSDVSTKKVSWPQVTRLMAVGDSSALAIFYNFTFHIMFTEAVRITGRDEQTCLDLVHDSMLKAIRSIKQLDDARAVKNWSRAVARSVTYDWLRRETRKQNHENDCRARSNEVHDSSDEPIDQARIVWLEQELQKLPAELQQLVSLRYRLGWSLQQIGQMIGLKTGTVDGRLRRAIEKLREKAEMSFDE